MKISQVKRSLMQPFGANSQNKKTLVQKKLAVVEESDSSEKSMDS